MAAVFAYLTIMGQREQMDDQRAQLVEQQQFIGEQRELMAEQTATLQMQRAELETAAEARRTAQARRVRMNHEKLRGRTGVGDDSTATWHVAVMNDSEAPLHGVEVRFGTAYTAAEVFEWFPGRAAAQRQGEPRTIPVHLLGAQRAVAFRSQEWRSVTAHNNRPTLFFTDDLGARWSLDSYGKLEEIAAS
ncbi:hypothetical protein ACWEHT_11600 [Streptomyces sp. NPDC004646]